ncbi:MAG: pyridoxal-dependent decarboxylase [Nitrospira sp.]|nr:pyridoxal-dependent decarboxylase [Nitrospira sp.]
MTVPYRELLSGLRQAFPQPVSDRVHDSYFIHSVMRAMDKMDALKSERPILGEYGPLDYDRAQNAHLPEKGMSVEDVTTDLVSYCSGLIIPGHPHTQQNVIPQPTISSLIGVLLASFYNPNLAWDEYSHRLAVAEVEMVAMMARLVGYEADRAGGFFTFGGTGTTLYGVKIGLEKAVPGAMEAGVREEVVLFASEASHYCRYNVAGWLGLGARSVVAIPTDSRNAMNVALLREQARDALQRGVRIAAIVVTMGTTDAFGIDDLAAVVAVRDALVDEFNLSYRPHVHADAVIGWAWAVFNEYDFEGNPLGFRPRTLRALAGAQQPIRSLSLADSLGIDFHKPGFAPYISSLVLFQNRDDLEVIRRPQEQMPYLFQFGKHRPGMYTVETSRAGGGILAALANMKLFGKQGLQVIIGHIVEMTQLLREYLEGHACATVLNRDSFGPVTLFRVYPRGVDTFRIKEAEQEDSSYRETLLAHNAYNRKIFQYVHKEAMAGRGVVLSLTDCYRVSRYGEPIVALKSFILSPFADEDKIAVVVKKVLEARDRIEM